MKHKRYICTQCGNCCKWEGYVHLKRHEPGVIAGYLQISEESFTSRYTRLAPNRKNLALIENSDKSCVFIDSDNHCMIQPVKPEQCQQFPNEWDIPRFRQKCRAHDTLEKPEA